MCACTVILQLTGTDINTFPRLVKVVFFVYYCTFSNTAPFCIHICVYLFARLSSLVCYCYCTFRTNKYSNNKTAQQTDYSNITNIITCLLHRPVCTAILVWLARSCLQNELENLHPNLDNKLDVALWLLNCKLQMILIPFHCSAKRTIMF